MHRGAVRDINARRKTSGDRNPTNLAAFNPVSSRHLATNFGPQTAFDECTEGFTQLGSPFLGRNQQVVRKIDSRLHSE